MKKDNREIGEIIDSAKTYIIVTNESVVAKGRRAELMTLVSTLLNNFFKNKIIDDDDLNFIIKMAKKDIKENSKEDIEEKEKSLEITINLDEVAKDIVKKLFNFENKD